jgi:hypothetical protein
MLVVGVLENGGWRSETRSKELTAKVRLIVLLTMVVLAGALATAAFAKPDLHRHLAGDNEVPSNLSLAQGQAMFWLNNDGTAIEYKLIAANIDNIFQAHIHNASAGANGPIVAWLYPDAPPAQLIVGPFNGVLAGGSIEAGDLTGPLAGHPSTLLNAA